MTTSTRHDVPGSFRDPSGVVFERDGALYREVRHDYRDHYDHLMQSGLYGALVEEGLLDSLRSAVKGLHWRPEGTEWADYERGDSYVPQALAHKEEIIRQFIEAVRPESVWDLGANTGRFSRIAAELGASTVAFDLDPAAVERHWLSCVERGEERVLPLVLDLANPSPAMGWAHQERMSLAERGPAAMVLALALIHHMVIGNNVPLPRVASFLASLAPWLAIEFVPREDPKVRQLLAHREDIFSGYTQANFESAFQTHYEIEAVEAIRESHRTLYLLRRK